MTPIDVLTSPDVVLACALLLGAGALELPLEAAVMRRARDHAALEWAWQHVFGPWLRAALLSAFVLITYPALFGLRTAPTVDILLYQGELRFNTLVNVLFIVGLVTPLLPGWQRRSGLVTMLQGLVACALMFHAYTAWLGAGSVSPWPGLSMAMIVASVALVSHHAAEQLGRSVGGWLDDALGRDGFVELTPHVTALAAQIPVVLCYGYVLGRQLAI